MFSNSDINCDLFNKLGYVYLKNLLTEELCNNFTNLMLDFKNSNKLSFEGSLNSHMYKNSYGLGSIKEMESFLKDITPDLSNFFNLNIKPANSYARIYYNGSTLNPHVDRPGLNYTISVTLFSNLKNEWPLIAIDKEKNEVKCNINRGDGLMILGTEIKHWREPLVCSDHEYVVQMFLHWTQI